MPRTRLLSVALALAFCVLSSPRVGAGEDDPLARAAAEEEAGRYAEALDVLHDAHDAAPRDTKILLALARVSEHQARAALADASSAAGQLGLADALGWYQKARELAPDSKEALTGVARVAIDTGDYAVAESAWSAVVKLAPGDAEAWFQRARACFLGERWDDAIRAFDAAETRLGADPRILLDRGIAQARSDHPDAAERDLLAAVNAEIGAGRSDAETTRSALLWLWRARSGRGEFAKAEASFSRLAADHPGFYAAPWYVGHARLAAGDAAGAARAFQRVTELTPAWGEAWRQYGAALVAAGNDAEAIAALEKELELDPGGQAPRSLLFEIVRALQVKTRIEEAIALLVRLDASFPDDPVVIELRGDLEFEVSDERAALADWQRAQELDPYARDAAVKAEKCATILLRAGTAPEAWLTRRMEARRAPAGPGGTIFDFETTGIYARAGGSATYRREGGAFRLVRGTIGTPSNLTTSFLPTLDFRPFASLRFRVRGAQGKALVLGADDCRTPLTVDGQPVMRLVHERPIELTGEWQTVTVPAFAFRVAAGARPGEPVFARMQALLFEIGAAALPGVDLAAEILIDDIELVRPDGSTFVVANFDREPEEDTFLTSGGTMPSSPPATAEAVLPDPSTFVNPVIFGKAFDPATVHTGTGSFRIRLAEKGLAEVALSLLGGRDYTKAAAITFWARGAEGGERLRISLEDTLDEEIGNAWPASSPRAYARYRLLEGWYELTPRWRRYVIPCSSLPDIDFRKLVRIRFIMGTDLGNEVGTTMYVDDIGWE